MAAAGPSNKKLKIDPMSGMFALKSTPCFIENFSYTNILDYCDVLDEAHKVSNNYRHALKKGETMFFDKFVTSIHFTEMSPETDPNKEQYKFSFRSKVKAEMKKRESYLVKSWISAENKVLCCESECAGGARPACCKHAFALLYAVLDYSKNKMFSAPTEKLQAWHHPRPFVVSPKKTSSCFKNKDTSPSTSNNCFVNYEALRGLSSVSPIFSVCMLDKSPIDSVINYDKSIALPDFEFVGGPDDNKKNYEFLSDAQKKYFDENVFVSLKKAQKIEHDTQCQSSSDLWFQERKCRLTASNVFKIINAIEKPSTIPELDELAEKILSPNDISHLKPVAMGKLREPMVQNIVRHTYKNYTFRETGLCIHPSFSFIAGSPDGFLFDGKDDKIIVEIKTIFNVKRSSLADLVNERKHFCIAEEDGNFKVNKKHSYYFQMQCQMFCSNIHKCLFALLYCENKPLYTECIEFDKKFWDDVFPSLEIFFFQHYLPKLI